jgi:hypothetical protein
MIKQFPFLAVALIVSLTASAQSTKRIPLTASQNPSGAELPFSAAGGTSSGGAGGYRGRGEYHDHAHRTRFGTH